MSTRRREPRVSPQVRSDAIYYALGRCCRPGCRCRGTLELHGMASATGKRRPGVEELVVLCSDCRARTLRGDFTVEELQLWRLRTADYFENVGAE